MPDKSIAIWQAYADANPPNILPGDAMALQAYVDQFAASREPAYLDAALEYCANRGLPALPELLAYVVQGIAQRRDTKVANTKPVKQAVKSRAMMHMANLIARGCTVEIAAEIASAWTQDTLYPYKASTLDKDYPAEGSGLQASIERDLAFRTAQGDISAAEVEQMRMQYRAFIDGWAGIPEGQKGNRRL
ncbi:MAG: hypothetical protein ACK4ZW_07345 [Blastomonas sp.]